MEGFQRGEGWHPAPSQCPGHSAHTAPSSHIIPKGCAGISASPACQQTSLPRGSRDRATSGHPSPAVTSWSGLPLQPGGGFAEPIPVPPRSPHTRGPPCPRILQHSRLKHPAGGWERLAALPRRFSFIKHKAGGGFSQAVGTAESLFSAASGRKMEGGQETGRPLPLFSFRGGKRTGWGV